MSTKTKDLSSRIQTLQERLGEENSSRERMDLPPFTSPQLGSGRRPNNLGELTPTSSRKKNLGLPTFLQPVTNRIEPETENKLKKIMKRNGILNINKVAYQTEIKDLEDLGELGNGTSGHVVKMKHKPTNTIIAVKQMRRTGNNEENKRIIMDIDVVLKSHDCPYIVQCLGCFITEADVWICMELMATCFDKLLKKSNLPVPEDILGKVTVATVKALSYLKEKHGVIHRDIKPSNILIDERGNIKLCDFGISGRLVDSKAKTRSAGCAAYMAPERIDPKKPEYDIRADVWSLGITLVELATGSFPYKGCNTDFEVLTRVLESDPPSLPTDKGFSFEFQTFVKKCLTKNYHGRPKYPELLELPFLKRFEQTNVDVPAWFASVMEKAGLRSHCSILKKQPAAMSSSPTTQSPPMYQHRNQHLQTLPEINGTHNGPPPLLPKTNNYTKRNGFNKDETDIVSEMNQMYRQSPFMQKRCDIVDFENSSKNESIYNNLAQTINRNNKPSSPYIQRKLSQPQEGFWNLQHPPDGVGGNDSNSTSPSPLLVRKIFQTTIPVVDSRIQGNTSPIVLQRFYHQQSQLRERGDKRSKPENTNPFLSHIPKYHPSPPPFTSTTTSTTMCSPQNQLPGSNISNYESNFTSNIQSHYNNQLPSNSPKNQFVFTSSNVRKPASPPQNAYIERGGSSSGYGNQNVYSNNLYGRTMTQDFNDSTINGQNDGIRNDQGVVKRRFASYVKLHLTAGENKDKERERLEKRPYATASQLPISIIQPPSPHVLSGIDRRHRSPDPPPRYNRGQSPLLLRRNLLEYGQSPSSPISTRRYTSSPPLPPPRRGSESVPGSPQHLRTRIHYTPEPQRRIYRSMDQ